MRLSDAYVTALEPSPISPTFGDPVWEIFAGTIRSSIAGSPRREMMDKKGIEIPVIVTPSLGLGNTGASFLGVFLHI
jgi:Gly-Xaa carboxypeptidase